MQLIYSMVMCSLDIFYGYFYDFFSLSLMIKRKEMEKQGHIM